MPGDYTKAFIKIANHENDSAEEPLAMAGQLGNSTTLSIVPFDGHYCECTTRLATKDSFYCPVTSSSCEVWTGFKSKDNYSVSCTNENWMVAYARYVFADIDDQNAYFIIFSQLLSLERYMWYYLIFWFAFLALSLLLTAPGQHAIKYILSRRFPSINHRIVDLIVELERNRQMQTQVNMAYERYVQRRRDGWVTGYKLKTRRYSGADEKAENEGGGSASVNTDDIQQDASENDKTLVKSEEECHSTTGGAIKDENAHSSLEVSGGDVSSVDGNICIICLLDIEAGDIIADVKCGHHYHADCLKEWILKKVRS
jgi:hypothetical protein